MLRAKTSCLCRYKSLEEISDDDWLEKYPANFGCNQILPTTMMTLNIKFSLSLSFIIPENHTYTEIDTLYMYIYIIQM